MQTQMSRQLGYITSFIACFFMTMATGCASGGYKLTRQYAGFVNKQTLLLRVILYLLTGIVFAVTMLVDMVIFNTVDFWQGRVSAGDYQFKSGETTYHARHEVVPGTQLKLSTIKVLDKDLKQIQEVVLRETTAGEIEMIVDGQLRTRVRDISSLPVASIYDSKGNFMSQKLVPMGDTESGLVASR